MSQMGHSRCFVMSRKVRLAGNSGPTCYNRFVRWRRAGIWDRIMNGLATAQDAAVQMIDTSIVRVHQRGACIAANREQHMGRSPRGPTSKVHAMVDAGLPVRLPEFILTEALLPILKNAAARDEHLRIALQAHGRCAAKAEGKLGDCRGGAGVSRQAAWGRFS
jgi:hypothetical protein